MSDFDNYRDAVRAGAIIQAATLAELASKMCIPAEALQETCKSIEAIARGEEHDIYGRSFDPAQLLQAPYYAARVAGALFHTQGGLVIDTDACVSRRMARLCPTFGR